MSGLVSRFSMLWRNRSLRTRVVRGLLPSIFRTAETNLVGVGQLPVTGINRILVIRPNHRLGNALLLTPLIIELERVFPGAEIDIVVGGHAAPNLFNGFASTGHIFRLPRYMIRHPIFMFRTVLRIRQTHYDLAIDPTEGSNSGRLFLQWARPRYAVGVSDALSVDNRGWRPLLLLAPRHMAQLPVYLLRHSLSSEVAVDVRYPTLAVRLTAAELRAGERTLNAMLPVSEEGSPRIIVGIFANATGDKCYGEAWWTRLIAAIRANRPEFLIVEIVAAHGRSQLGSHFPSFFSSSPRKMASVIANLTCFISADCGVMHLGSASGAPTVGLFSVTDSSKYGPYGRDNHAVCTDGKSPDDVAAIVLGIVENIAPDVSLKGN
jgi:heptosyltransferase-3